MILSSIPTPQPYESSAPDRGSGFPAAGRAAYRDGFGLTEVAISMGIIAFVLVSLLGLMSVGMRAGRESREDTIVAALSKDVFSGLKTNTFSSLTSARLYFDYDGHPVGPGSNAYFACDLAATNHNLPFPGLADASRAKRVRMGFSWPASAPAAARTTQVFETTLANYD